MKTTKIKRIIKRCIKILDYEYVHVYLKVYLYLLVENNNLQEIIKTSFASVCVCKTWTPNYNGRKHGEMIGERNFDKIREERSVESSRNDELQKLCNRTWNVEENK